MQTPKFGTIGGKCLSSILNLWLLGNHKFVYVPQANDDQDKPTGDFEVFIFSGGCAVNGA
jgi:hypothetical protein